jgi:hypothetical protein
MTETTPIFVHIIADYGPVSDMAFAEVRQALRYEMRDKIAHMESSSVPAFDTIATGFKLAQLAINDRLGGRQFYYVNTAPRRDTNKARENNEGEGLVYAKLKNGVEIVAVNSGYSLSFIKEHAQMLRVINCSAEGSQFRSRDVFPAAFGLIVHGDYSQLGTNILDSIPEAPENAIAYVDGYGNIKTTIDVKKIEASKGKSVTIIINGQSHDARISDGIFQSVEGDLVMSAGSSGWMHTDSTRLQFVEISLRGSSAAAKFNLPKGGEKVSWK